MENIIIITVFLGAIYYLGTIVWKNFFAKNSSGCAKGCGSCGNIDFEKIVKEQEGRGV